MLLAERVEYEAMMRSRPGDPEPPSLADLLRRPAWHAHAACRGQVDVMFPVRGESLEPARELCRSCPVVDECADDIPDAEQTVGAALPGVWAGTSQRERRRRSASRPGAAVEDRRARVADLYAEGHDVAAIAAAVGVHTATVHRYLRGVA